MSSQLDNRIATIIQQRNERDAILSSLEEGVLALDANENIVSINKKALELLDISNDDVIGKSIQEIVRNDKLHDLIDKSLKQSTDVEGEMHIQVGDEKYLSVYGTLLLNSDNNQIGTVIVLNDISKIKKLDIIRRDFVANVSHELKTPITAIKGSAETLLEGALDNRESAVQFTTIINRHAKRLIAIVQDLLTLAKFENEQVIQSIKFNNETLYPALESAVFACEQKYSSKNIQVSIYCPDDLVVSMHRHYLEHAIINLLDNAIKYSDDNATVTIAVEKQDNKIIISVTDQGSGIDSQHLPRLFERFYRVDMARSRELGGTGLGLAIVKHIARVHKGTVDVKSVPGEGSTFSIIIPS